MSTFEIILAGAIVLAGLLQIALLVILTVSVSRFTKRANRLIDSLEPQIRDVGGSVRSVRENVEVATAELRATLAGVRATTDVLGNLAQDEGREIARLVEKTTSMAEQQLEETDHALHQARQRITELGDRFDQSILEPARAALSMAVAVRKGFEALFVPRSKSTAANEGPDESPDESPDEGPDDVGPA